MCGEHYLIIKYFPSPVGSSPHVRGALPIHLKPVLNARIIPACAGSTIEPMFRQTISEDHPRMCGEHASTNSRGRRKRGSSPHVRGAHNNVDKENWRCGIIPACAGSTQ